MIMTYNIIINLQIVVRKMCVCVCGGVSCIHLPCLYLQIFSKNLVNVLSVTSLSSLSPVCRCPSPPLRTCQSTPPGPRALVCPPPPASRAPCACGRATGLVSSQRSGSPAPTSPGWRCSSRSGSPRELRGGEMRSEKGVQRDLQSESSRTSSWGGVESCDLYREGNRIVAVISVKKNKEGYPCIQRCPLSLVSSLLQGFEQQDPGLKSGCVLHKNQRLII